MRRPGFDIKSIIIAIIIINVVIFFLTQLNSFPITQRLLNNLVLKDKLTIALAVKRYGLLISLFSLFPVMIREMGWIWQFFSYMFLHGSFLHLFFNMYALLLFGRPLEERWGWKEFLFFYLATGIGAGIVTYFWNMARNPFIPTIGASGAIFGIILAFGLEFPETILLLFFIIPVRARYAALIFGGIELVMIITGKMQGIGHFTHLAGLFFGYIYYILRIRGSYGKRQSMFPRRLKEVISEKKAVHVKARKEQVVQKALMIRDKIRMGDNLSSPEVLFLNRLRDAYNQNKTTICTVDEFNITSEFCKKCDDFFACVYRYIIQQL